MTAHATGHSARAVEFAARAEETPHAFLRRVTRPWHDGVEAAFERFDLQTRDGLSAFLIRQAMALLPLETALEAGGVETLLADWPQRRRANLLIADLQALGLTVPALREPPRLDDPFLQLGALYVLEGSKLGGRVLHRRVETSQDHRVVAASRFLGHRQDRGWASFLALLEASARDGAERDGLAAGSEAAFTLFHAAALTESAISWVDADPCSRLYDRAQC